MAKSLQDYTKEELIEQIKSLKKTKKFGLVWEDKPEQVAIDCETKLPVLTEVTERAITKAEDQPTNLIIEGDNYHSLSTLNYTHAGSIDVIYIDPPYNTGNKDFVYNDHFVDKEDGFRHSKWLSFMAKRLKLANELLAPTGVIFISIDDNELSNLKLLCDSVFGSANFLSQIIIKSNPRGSQASKHFAITHEYLLVYAKNSSLVTVDGYEKSEENIAEYSLTDNAGRYRLLGLRQRGGAWRREQRPNLYYPLFVNPDDGTVSLEKTGKHHIEALPHRPTGEAGRWTWSSDKVKKNISLLVGKKVNRAGADNFYDIFRKNYLASDDGEQVLSKPRSIWDEKELNYQNGRTELKNIFNDDIFDYPKPTYLIRQVIGMFIQKDMTVLDFFAGSGTTGQAVLELNRDDGGNRKFILCSNNENSIVRGITYPRIKGVIDGYADVDGIPANLRYFKTSFVDKADNTDQTRVALVARATDMIKVRENTFDTVSEEDLFKVYEGADTYSVIVFDPSVIDKAKAEIIKLSDDKAVRVYVFSLANDSYVSDFADLDRQVELCPIPESILEVYKRIFDQKGTK